MTGFDHVYVEETVRHHPRTEELLRRIKPARLTEIVDAHRFFNRPGQDFSLQKERRKLILTTKRDNFLYRADERILSFGGERDVYYNDVLRNCLYDCDYCFLQGMHRSANILLHVNLEDYLAAVDRKIREVGKSRSVPLYLSVSYLTDLLGFERPLGLARYWIEAARSRPDLEIEIRTKSDGFNSILECDPVSGVILTWSLSPERIAREQEQGTAAFQQRLIDARRAIQAGWRVRLCFDPVIAHPGWESLYDAAVEETFRRLKPDRVEAVSFGVFRMHPDFYRHLPRERRSAAVSGAAANAATGTTSNEPVGAIAGGVTGEASLIIDDHGARSYEPLLRNRIFSTLREKLLRHLPEEKIHGVHG